MPAQPRTCLMCLVVVALVALPSATPAAPDAAHDPTVEPVMEMTLTIGQAEHAISFDQPLDVIIDGRPVTMTLRAKPDRLFRVGSIRFRYPMTHGFEADTSTPGIRIFTLDGNSNVIMLQEYGHLMPAQQLLAFMTNAMTAQYGNAARVSPTSIELGEHTLKGNRLDVTLAGERLVQDLFPIKTPEGGYVLMIQDSPQDDGQLTQETQEAIKLLKRTFALE